ncbi:hypothetical protein Celal_0267 [Cellulophaga algicola DSM 14237]|uniref:Lipocalin-like domain-containing protein n=1 Tax=Cellulophaga algicola (strain DSM 14237 / IC166 / ACAM 630) TaxID=688270 RepID=E6X8M6_CELAD|nr:hypothetical protein [Cellulophaga algicola]ADV47613.1 hypothetical protein Celal_0267 [Cellulophaga algicola DSM 14237]
MINSKCIVLLFSLFLLTSCGVSNKSSVKNKKWLEGKWTGIGYQTDLQEASQWTIALDIEKGNYNISYPSLYCAGKWKLTKYSEDQATFTELIENNTTTCIKNGTIILTKIDETRILYSYFYNDGINNDGKKAAAFSTLEKQ